MVELLTNLVGEHLIKVYPLTALCDEVICKVPAKVDMQFNNICVSIFVETRLKHEVGVTNEFVKKVFYNNSTMLDIK